MKKRSGPSGNVRPRKKIDRQVGEFEKRDLGDDIRGAGAARLVRPRSRPTSIFLDQDLVAELRKKAVKRGLGYQTMLKMIVREHLDEY
jgi:predicted DNA binding CopG/RHH family protein